MKECPNCQKIYVDEATFCSICGYRLKPQESPKKILLQSYSFHLQLLLELDFLVQN